MLTVVDMLLEKIKGDVPKSTEQPYQGHRCNLKYAELKHGVWCLFLFLFEQQP
jgi:hypothetical protein